MVRPAETVVEVERTSEVISDDAAADDAAEVDDVPSVVAVVAVDVLVVVSELEWLSDCVEVPVDVLVGWGASEVDDSVSVVEVEDS